MADEKMNLEIGHTGLKRWGGTISEEFLSELRGLRGQKIYHEMSENSAIIGGCLSAIEMLIRQVVWDVEPAGTDAEDVARAEFVEECLRDLSTPWTDVVIEHLSMLPRGFSVVELVYKRRDGGDAAPESRFSDGRIGWQKLAPRSQETLIDGWEFDENGGLKGVWQVAAPDFQRRFLPIAKLLLFRPRVALANPEGRSVLRNAYRSYYFAKRIEEVEGVGITRDLTGLAVYGIPPECFAADASAELKATKTQAEAVVRGITRDEFEGLVVPLDYQPGTSNKRYDFSLLTSGGQRQFDTSKIIERYDRRQALTMLHDILILGQPNTTTYKGKSMPNLFATALGGWLGTIAAVYNDLAIPRLFRLNGWPIEKTPQLKPGSVEAEDLGVLGDFLSKLEAAGFMWSKDSRVDARLRRAAGMPKRDPNAETAPPTSPDAGPPGAGPDNGADNQEPADTGEDQ